MATYADYLEASRQSDERTRYELVDGALFVVPSPGRRHQEVLGTLLCTLAPAAAAHGEVLLLVDVVLSDTDVVRPDLSFVSRERSARLTDENVRGAPDLVVEILSPATADRDRGDKLRLYGAHDVREYWIVDPADETIAVHRREAGRLALAATRHRGERLADTPWGWERLEVNELLGREEIRLKRPSS